MERVQSILKSLASITLQILYWVFVIIFWVLVGVMALIFGVVKAGRKGGSH